MEKKINIAELLKDCPKGMELDCLLFDGVVLECVDDDDSEYPIRIKTKEGVFWCITSDGCWDNYPSSKCVIFPKGETTWEGFVPPCQFKAGDVVTTKSKANTWISIYKEYCDDYCYTSADLSEDLGSFYPTEAALVVRRDIVWQRLATEEEKQELFAAIKENGYKWNAETKTLEELVEPKFKVGDNIILKGTSAIYVVTEIREDRYMLDDKDISLLFKTQDEWELVPNKFDISTLKPFDKVLVRENDNSMWTATLFSHLRGLTFYTVGSWYNQCIPFDGNEHLCGKTVDCDNYYKNWK